ncbi:peptide synthase [Streptomyces sp. YIM 130001]|uniref:phosphopantetheine-binding protein n=1 Tax=Streptomyces sp. YIM 130001 TaxID=2259644 RepID=UPI000E647783|nr:phosphopantetheine-binding protein [Streptomyces sp. YIM 130001]RII13798.1 peptide synthase [Streptomyces sp. YIM 130001]
MEATAEHIAGEAARIIAEVLEVREAPLDENFYDRGGTSLQAIRICARVRRDLGVKAAAETVFDSDTLGDFCAGLAAAGVAAAERPDAGRHAAGGNVV